MILIIVSPNYIVLANMILTLSSILAKSDLDSSFSFTFTAMASAFFRIQ